MSYTSLIKWKCVAAGRSTCSRRCINGRLVKQREREREDDDDDDDVTSSCHMDLHGNCEAYF